MIGQGEMVNVTEKKPLHDKSHETNAQGPQDQPDPEIITRILEDRKTEIGPQHVKTAVGEVQHAQNPEDQGQAAGHQPDEHPCG